MSIDNKVQNVNVKRVEGSNPNYLKRVMYSLLAIVAGIGLAERVTAAPITNFDLDGWQNAPYEFTPPFESSPSNLSNFNIFTMEAYEYFNSAGDYLEMDNSWEIGIFRENKFGESYTNPIDSSKVTFVGLMEKQDDIFTTTALYENDITTQIVIEGARPACYGNPADDLYFIAHQTLNPGAGNEMHRFFVMNEASGLLRATTLYQSNGAIDMGYMELGEEIVVPEPTTLGLLGLGGLLLKRKKEDYRK